MDEQDQKLAIWLIKQANDLFSGTTSSPEVVSKLRATIKRFSEISAPAQGTLIEVASLVAETPQEKDKSAESIREVFAYWVVAAKKTGTQLTAERQGKIRARLREGYTVDDMRKAIDGILISPWHREHEVNELTKALESGSNLERFRDMVHISWTPRQLEPTAAPTDPDSKRIIELRGLAKDAKMRGKREEYAKIIEELRKLSG